MQWGEDAALIGRCSRVKHPRENCRSTGVYPFRKHPGDQAMDDGGDERRQGERRQGDRRQEERREGDGGGAGRREGDRRQGDRRQGDRRKDG